MAAVVLVDLVGVAPVTANQVLRASWRTHHGVSADLRELAWADCRARRLRMFDGPVAVTLEVHPPDRRQRDADGLFPTLKRCLDGAVRAGALRQDDARWVPEVAIRVLPPASTWRLRLLADPMRVEAAA